ncbi:MAG TPA: GNAT family protein, partial [Polyangiaceae bacterium]
MLPSLPSLIAGDRLPTLPARRLALRWITPADEAALYEVFSNPDVMRYWSRTPFTHLGEATELRAAIEKCFAEQSLFQWGIARREDDRVLGTCTISHLDRSNGRAELGYALGRAHWGQGLMREALDALLPFAFGELGLRRLEADVDPANTASVKMLERLGFQREGYLRERWAVGGGVQDSLFYGLLRREWEAGRGG